MSYDLGFWRERPGAALDATAVTRLEDTQTLLGLLPIPLAEAEAAFLAEFPDIAVGGAKLDWEGEGSYFQVGYIFADERHVSVLRVCYGYHLLQAPTAFGRLRRVAEALGCRYVDLQSDAV